MPEWQFFLYHFKTATWNHFILFLQMAFVIMFNWGKKNCLPLNCKTLKKGNFRGKVLLLTLLTLLTLKRSVRNVSSDTSLYLSLFVYLSNFFCLSVSVSLPIWVMAQIVQSPVEWGELLSICSFVCLSPPASQLSDPSGWHSDPPGWPSDSYDLPSGWPWDSSGWPWDPANSP